MRQIVFLFCLLISITAICQMEAGIKSGVVMSRIIWTNDVFDRNGDFGYLGFGPDFGIYGKMMLSEKFTIAIENHFAVKGGVSTTTENQLKLNYLHTPLILGYELWKTEIQSGFYYDFFVNSNVGGDDFKSDLGYLFGAKADITTKLFFECRYERGLIHQGSTFPRIYTVPGSTPDSFKIRSERPKARNQAISFIIGYKLKKQNR